MNCKAVTDFLADYLDGTLPRRQRWQFKLHLLLCRNCRRYLSSYAAAIRLARSQSSTATDLTIPPAPDELVRAILASQSSEDLGK
jgi:predicted anti-sigma-YlaC factor YlaD